MLARLNAYAKTVSENGMIEVVSRDGVYWLTLTGPSARTLCPVGTTNLPVLYIREQIKAYFEGK